MFITQANILFTAFFIVVGNTFCMFYIFQKWIKHFAPIGLKLNFYAKKKP